MLLQGDELSQEQEGYVEKILFNAQRLSGLVGNILLLSRLENQNIPIKKPNIVWMNLLDNAIKFSPENGTITMFLRHENDSVQFILEDEGPGI